MDPAKAMQWTVSKVRCFVCEARAIEAEAHVEGGGSLDGLYFRVSDTDEEVIDDD